MGHISMEDVTYHYINNASFRLGRLESSELTQTEYLSCERVSGGGSSDFDD